MNQNERQKWIARIPQSLQRLTEKWDLCEITPIYSSDWYHVFSAVQSKNNQFFPVILKLGFDSETIKQEMIVLQFYQSSSRCVRLLNADIDLGALLLDRIFPGVSLKSLFPTDDTVAAVYAVEVMNSLHAVPLPAHSKIPTVSDWLRGLNKDHAVLQHHLPKARKLAKLLIKTQQKPVLLHADLHHDNILLSDKGVWIAIDPKGLIGEPAYEVGAFIRNPLPELLQQDSIGSIISKRLKIFADALQVNQERLKDWSYVQEVLSGCQAIEDGLKPDSLCDLPSIIDEL